MREVAEGLEAATLLAERLSEVGFDVQFVGSRYCTASEDRPPDFSVNVSLIRSCEAFVLVTVESKVSRSSVWVEAGLALAHEIPSVFIVPHASSLPTLIQSALAPASGGGSKYAHVIWIGQHFDVEYSINSLQKILSLYLKSVEIRGGDLE